MLNKLVAITYQLLDLGKRNRLLNYKDSGLKTLAILNKNVEEIFRNIKAYRDCDIYDLDPTLNAYHNENFAGDESDNVLQYSPELVYEIARKYLEPKQILCYKKSYTLNKTLKSLAKDFRFSIVEKGMNSLYSSFGFIHYTEEGEEYVAPLLLIPIELDGDGGKYTIRQYEDEIILNPTLKYYFSNAFNIELPDYKEEALSTFFEKVKASLPESVYLEETMAIGIYSFYKMNMYNDIMTHKDLVIKNDNIRTLLGDDTVIQYLENDAPIYPVVNCDSSQLNAIQMAANGKSFCLQGPPGSGKSQTITNMISSLLGAGKKILFVSEKIAALRVVFENLRRARLSEFAIELHSNKANKKEFIENLYRTATLPKYDMDLKTRFLNAKYRAIASKLRHYDSELMNPIAGIGVSLLDLYSIYAGIKTIELDTNVHALDYNMFDLDHIIELMTDYANYAKLVGYDYRESTLYGFNNVKESYILYELNEDLAQSIDLLEHLAEIVNYLNQIPGFDIYNVDDAIGSLAFVEKIVKLKTFSPAYFIKKARVRLLDLIEKYLSLEKTTKSEVLEIYDNSIMNENLDDLCAEYKKAMDAPKGFLGTTNKKLKELTEQILKYRTAKVKPEVIYPEIKELSVIKKNIRMANELIQTISKLLGYEVKSATLKAIVLDLKILSNTPDVELTKVLFNGIRNTYISFGITSVQVQEQRTHFMNIDKNILVHRKVNGLKDFIGDVLSLLYDLAEAKEHLTYYNRLTKTIDEISRYKALDFLHNFLDRNEDIILLPQVYKKTFIKERIDEYVKESNILSEFNTEELEEDIFNFRDLDEKILNINRDYIISTISQKRPNEVALEGSQFKILTHEYNKQRRQIPIRSLLEQTFELILDIKPVFLMSPLSVSTYLASELNMFDCVIFDEASQIFASDALGSIYRGKQCIIIGDTKQMPPTNFFHASIEDEDVEVDLESILDKASAMFDMTSLKWHYRSRSEELISFSNGSFYDGNLISVPQSKKHELGFGIDYYFVEDGRYEMTSRTNPIEAQKICDMVFEHFKERGDKESLGVVAFSNVQAELIQNLVERRLKKYPEYEKYFDDELDEPFFVKNLETVQGDERDRIIFSICYGYNEEGKFHQRFGPLNTSGGERRLNVAITRAKFNVSVVASIKYFDIQTKTEAKGVLLLRDYLEFAENVVTNKNYTESESTILNDVKQYVESLGYQVYPQYGTSAFKVELAIKKDDEFVLAIMTDSGSNYSTNITDRYRLEKLLLERLGWSYFKLYSTAWINDNENEKQRLKDTLEGKIEEKVAITSNKDSTYLRIDDSIDSVDFKFEEYRPLDISVGKKIYTSKGMAALVNEIIQKEAPIHREHIYKIVAQVLDKAKPTTQIKDDVDKSLPEKVIKIGDFLYANQVSDVTLRTGSDRDIMHVPDEELLDGLRKVVQKNNGIKVDGAYRTVVNALGIDKISQNARKRLDDALEHLLFDKTYIMQNGALFRK